MQMLSAFPALRCKYLAPPSPSLKPLEARTVSVPIRNPFRNPIQHTMALSAFAAPVPLSLSPPPPSLHPPTSTVIAPTPTRRRRAPRSLLTATASSPTDASLHNTVIIGSGPAGYTAALYTGRANLRPILLEGVRSGVAGGQLMTTDAVENFPGFPDGVTGPNLMQRMRQQALNHGAIIIPDDCTAVDLDTFPYEVRSAEHGVLRANSVIVATGASAKRLGIANEAQFWSRGITGCAVCDGAAPIFRGADIAVVGGGDTACEEAVYMLKYARSVHVLVRSGSFKASAALVDRVNANPRITVHFHTVILEALGTEQLSAAATSASSTTTAGAGSEPPVTYKNSAKRPQAKDDGSPLKGLKIRDSRDGSERILPVSGLFYAIGHNPNTSFLRGNASRLRFDTRGYIRTGLGGDDTDGEDEDEVCTRGLSVHTDQAGVFAAGDVSDPCWRQAATAAAAGTMAALATEQYLSRAGLVIEHEAASQGAVVTTSVAVDEESAEEVAVQQRGTDDDEATYDIENTWHSGQFALRKLYHESTRPLVVKYQSPNCGPCQQLKPMLHSVIRSFEGAVHYVEIDIQRDAEISEAAGITGSPTVQVFFEKSLVKELRGVKMKSDYRQVIESLLGQPGAVQ